MESGSETARSIAEKYLARIEEIDQAGPGVNAVIEINPDALASADELDNERRSGAVRGPLHGIPILIKDNIDTADRMATTAGSLALEGSVAAQDSGVAAALRRAGALILGKTNLSEWANFRSLRLDQRLERQRRADAKPLRAGPQTRAARARAPARPRPRTFARARSAPRPTAPSSARRRSTGSWGSSRLSG